MGGRVGFGAGLHAPGRFDSIVIGGGSFGPAGRVMDRAAFPGATAMIVDAGIECFLSEWETRRGAPLPPPVREVYLANDHRALAAYLRATEREHGLDAALQRMTMPVLLFAGEHDQHCLEQSREAAARLPSARLHVFPGESHASTILRPDKVVPVVRSFLSAIPVSGCTVTLL